MRYGASGRTANSAVRLDLSAAALVGTARRKKGRTQMCDPAPRESIRSYPRPAGVRGGSAHRIGAALGKV
jgi:hypothetical protein